VLQLRHDGEFVVARVSANSVLLPSLSITAEAVSVAEPTAQ
jgi:hypothetical protein